MKFWNKRTFHKRDTVWRHVLIRGQNYGDLCKLKPQSCRVYIFLWKPKCFDCNSLETNWTFFWRCYRLGRLKLWEVRSTLPWHRWFCNCLVMACVLFMFVSGVLRVISNRKYSTPLCFPTLALPALRAPWIISGFRDIRVVLKWGFIQAGAGVISNTWAQTKVKIA